MPSKPPSLKPARQRKPWARPVDKPDTRTRGRRGQEMRHRRLARTGYLCEHCLTKGVTTPATVVNHKVALAHDGPDIDENTENLCAPCDAIATAKQFGRRPPRQTGSAPPT